MFSIDFFNVLSYKKSDFAVIQSLNSIIEIAVNRFYSIIALVGFQSQIYQNI
jgi:hypothetical protein